MCHHVSEVVHVDAKSHYHGKLGKGGRIVVPALARKALGLKPGDDVTLELRDGELRVWRTADSVRRAQEIIARYVPKGRDLAGELIAERRREFAGE